MLLCSLLFPILLETYFKWNSIIYFWKGCKTLANKIEASVGLSRKWDAREAGREVAKTVIKNLNRPPSFFLIYSTIHYKDHGGFEELLNGIWDVIPKGTPLIGCTVSCFINNYGCFSRGVSALAVFHPKMDVALGVGTHSKRNPKRAGRTCANMIKKQLKTSKFKNKLVVTSISSGKLPLLPMIGRVQIIKSKFFAWLATYLGMKLFPMIGYGLGKEEDVIEEMSKCLPDFYLIGGSAEDSGDFLYNYQFINDKVLTNSVVAIGCKIDGKIFLRSLLGLHETDKVLEVTDVTPDGTVIKEFNKKPAKEQILQALDIVEEQFKNLGPFYYRTSLYFPLTFDDNKSYTSGIGGFFGDYVYLGHKIQGSKVRLLSITGDEIINMISNSFKDLETENFPFVFMTSSAILVNALGGRAYMIKDKLDDYIGGIPYLMMCPMTEYAGTPTKKAIARVYSFNALSIENNNYKIINKI